MLKIERSVQNKISNFNNFSLGTDIRERVNQYSRNYRFNYKVLS